jgi:hypothetical protein
MRFRTWTGVAATIAVAALAAQAQQMGAPPPTATPTPPPVQAPATASLARLEVRETAFNFGFVPQGYAISHTFWLKNAGSDTLRITDVRPG